MIKNKKSFSKVLRSFVGILGALFSTSILFLSDIAFSATVGNTQLHQAGIPPAPRDFSDIACSVVKVSLDFIPYLVIFAIADFMIGLIKYVRHGDNEEKRTEGTKMMVYGTLGFFFLVSIWGIIKLFTASFGLGFAIPQFNTGGPSFLCG